MHRLGLRLKFILIISAVLLIIFAFIGFFFIRNARITVTNNLNSESKAFAALATKAIGDTYGLYNDSGTVRIQNAISNYTDLDESVNNVGVVNVDGSTAFSLHATPKINISSDVASSFDPSYKVNSNNQIVQIVQPYTDDNGFHSYAIVYSISTSEVDQAIQHQEFSIVLFVLVGLLVSALTTYEAINYFFLRPIQRVSRLATLISLGRYTQQIELDRGDEIGDLADSVNRMADSLKADIRKLEQTDKLKNEFIMITSHNLRTPLTIIQGGVSVLQMADGLEEQAKKLLGDIEDSAHQLSGFAEQMLTIASIEAGGSQGKLAPIKLSDVLIPLQHEFTAVAANKKLTFTLEGNSDVPILGNKQQLTGALQNLLDNAFKFTHQGGVRLSVREQNKHLEITVSDTGIGIAADELPKLFTKFHRGTDTLKYNYEGTGIGLYATKLIIEQHGGGVSVASTPGKGTTFTVSLPIAPAIASTASPATPLGTS